MKKDKIYELRIEEDDEISGIDSISLVEEPAIEIGWIAFKKEKPQDFHIPDGEDEKYLNMLMEKGQSEEELINEGWVPFSVEIDGEENFVSTNPNADSDWNENNLLIRYKYILSPRITGQAAVIPTTRAFCRDLIAKNYVWRVEDMDATQNDFGESAMVWRGGYNCRHNWAKIKYKKDTNIINKASVNKGKATGVDGFPSDMVPDLSVIGYEQPLTVTDRVIESVQKGTNKPSTIKNLGLSKHEMEIDENNVNVFGYHTRYYSICPGAQSLFRHLITMEVSDSVEGMIRSAAQAADNVFRIESEVIESGEGTQHQLEEAIVLVDDFKDIMKEVDNLVGMTHDVSFMDGHIMKINDYVEEMDLGYDVGGLPAYVDQLPTGKTKNDFVSYSDYPQAVKENAKKVIAWVEENGWGSCGTNVGKIRANQLADGRPISMDTIYRMYSYLSRHKVDLITSKNYNDGCGKLMYDSWGGEEALRWAERKINQVKAGAMSKQKFVSDDEKRIVIGPAMIPNLKIFRKDKKGNPYYVYFTSDTIKMIAEKYMKNKYIDNNDKNHDGKAVEDVYVIESWIKEDMEDKSNKYGFEDLPIGTWFVSMKVKNDEVWNMVKEGKLKGFSVSGYFEEIAQFAREEMFLKQLEEILKNIKD